MSEVLLNEVKQCLTCLVDAVNLGDDNKFSMDQVLTFASNDELNATVFGWLAAKGLWDNYINTKELIAKAREEMV